MAKIISSEVDSRTIIENFSYTRVLIIGLLSGLLFWFFTWLLNDLIITPLSCSGSVGLCNESLAVSGKIASTIIMLAQVIVMIKLRMVQPLIVSVATASVLWGLAEWTNGLALWEVILWNVATYMTAYLLFCWIVRYDKMWWVLAGVFAVVVVARIVANI